jgi:hypothetical protein
MKKRKAVYVRSPSWPSRLGWKECAFFVAQQYTNCSPNGDGLQRWRPLGGPLSQ